MNSVITPPPELLPAEDHRTTFWPVVSWAAVFAGLAAALALHIVFMLLGASLGFALYSPLTDANPLGDLGTGAVIIEGISAVLSLWFGGWVAGRFTPVVARATGCLHGFLVWCGVTIVGVLIVSSGAGWAAGGLSKIVGGGLALAGRPVAVLTDGAAAAAKESLKQAADSLTSFTDEAVSGRAPNSPQSAAIRAKRKIGSAVARYFSPTQHDNQKENRAALEKILVTNANMSEADADRTITDWTTSYDQLRADLNAAKNEGETKSRELADRASHDLAIFALCAFAAFVLGGLSASLGGSAGAKHALKNAL
ncbi:MAG: hypothetical protein ABI222_14460 [Opitutaceae bacterium]